jgi:hypothetical protein
VPDDVEPAVTPVLPGGSPVRAYLQTRGTARAADYAFLGGAPPEPWWRSYREVTAFDHPTVLIASDGERWSAYLSGIPSSRVDAVGTVVRYTLVLDGPCRVSDTACVPAAVAAWLDDVADGARPGGRLAAALDARFPVEDVEHWLAAHGAGPDPRRTDPDERHSRPTDSDGRASRPNRGDAGDGAPATAEVSRRVLAALAALPAVPGHADEPGDWIGAVGAPGPKAAFTARVADLLAGTPGRAVLLNLVGGPADALPLLDPASPVAVLVESSDPHLGRCTALRPVVEAKKVPAPRPSLRRPGIAAVGIAVVPLVAAVGVLAMTALVVTLLVWLL